MLTKINVALQLKEDKGMQLQKETKRKLAQPEMVMWVKKQVGNGTG